MSEKPASDLRLERLALDEATATDRERLGAPAGAAPSPEIQARLSALRESDAAILAQYPAPQVAAEIGRRLERARREQAPRRVLAWLPTVATAACALGAVLVYAIPRATQPPTPLSPGELDTQVRNKGLEPHLQLFRKEGDKTVQLGDGATARAGESIQLGYVAAGQRYGVILSIDGRGSVTLHFPATKNDSPELRPGGAVLLERAFGLDDAPGFERFILVTTDAAHRAELSVESVLASAQTLAADPQLGRQRLLPLPPGFRQTSVLLRKE